MQTWKICLLSDTYPPQVGGLAVSTRRMAQALAGEGHQVHVITPGRTSAFLSDGPVTIHRVEGGKRLRETLARWFEYTCHLDAEVNFDLFHGYFVAYAGYIATLAARYGGKKAVVSARGNDVDVMPFEPDRAAFVFKALEWADAITAVTHQLARKVAALSGRPDVRVIHNGVDAELFTPLPPEDELRSTLGLGKGPVVGFVGEARAKKGIGTLLRIFPRIHQETGAQLLLVGGARREVREMVELFKRRYPHVPLVQVPPQPHKDMPRYYALLDVLAMPSLRDGLPNALLEAMACGCVVVASNVGGMPEAITDGVDGMLLPPGQDEAWTEAILHLLQNPQEAKRLGYAARTTILERFSAGKELQETLSLYRELLAESPSSKRA